MVAPPVGLRPPYAATTANGAPVVPVTPLDEGGPFWTPIGGPFWTPIDNAAIEALRSLRDGGVHIAFDDFGTGYASLTTIKQLPLSRLKIDKSFVHDMHEDKGSAAIVDGIVSISKTMQIDVVAEGIENWQQVGRLRQAGCKHGQGYLFGKAMTPDLLSALLLSAQL